MPEGMRRFARVLGGSRKRLQVWLARGASFYFGFKILHHEIYDVTSPDVLVLCLGLWLCGIAPSDVLDNMRRMGDKVTGNDRGVRGEDSA